MKRSIALILCLMMLVSLLPAAAFAEGEPAEDEEIIFADDEIIEEAALAEEEIPAADEASDEEKIPEAPAEEETPEAAEEPAEEIIPDESEDEIASDELIADDEIPAEPETEDDENELGTVVASGNCGDNLTWSLDDKGKLTISGSGSMENYDFQTGFMPPWYSQYEKIKTVSISQGITSIGSFAFTMCDNMTSVSIPSSVKTIGDGAFTYTGLKTVTIPSSVTSIGYAAFDGTALTTVEIPASVTSIGDQTFGECSSLTAINVASGNSKYKSVDGVLFTYDGKTLLVYPCGNSNTSYTISSGVTRIYEDAFNYCNNLTSITIPSSVTTIDSSAFRDCAGLKSIKIPDSVTSLGSYAFYNCTALNSISLSSKLTKISKSCFSKCTALKNIAIPSGVTIIDQKAFENCDNLQSVTIPGSVTGINGYAFYACLNLTSVTIPGSVTSLAECAFGACQHLSTVTFSGNAPSFGNNVFYGVTATAYYPAGDSTWTSSVMQNYGGTITWKAATSGKCGDNVYWALDSSGKLTISGSGAMYDYVTEDPGYEEYKDQIVSIEVKSGITKIGACDFYTYKALTSVTLANTVTDIGASAFEICRKLTSITIPKSVTSIGNYAFSKCSALTTIYFTGDAPSIGTKIFSGVTATAYYPYDNSTWTSSVMQQYGGTITWKANGGSSSAHGTPVISSILNHQDYMVVLWGKVEGATSYKLAYRAGSGAWQTMDVSLTAVDSKGNPRVNIKGLTVGTTYTFIVYANFSDGTSSKSASATQVRLLSPKVTVNKYGTNASNGGFQVSWSATEGGSCYKIYYREKGGSWALYTMIPKSANTLFCNIKGSVTNSSSKLPDLVAGKTYEFAVLTATSQTNITSGFPTSYTGYTF